MAAPKGNVYYTLAVNFKKPKLYTPAKLWLAALAYFKWVETHPLYEHKAFANGTKARLPKMRAMTISAFCLHASMARDTFNRYEKEENYSDICARIKEIIANQKFEGAAADLLNPAIIARDLGLVDKKDVTTNGESLNQAYYEQLKKRRKQSGQATDQTGD